MLGAPRLGPKFLKNSGTDPKLFFDVLSGWGGQVQPQKWWKIVGTAPFPSPRPGKSGGQFSEFFKWE